MSESITSEGENWRPIDESVSRNDVLVAMSFVFSRFPGDIMLPERECELVEHNGQTCIAVGVLRDNPMTDFQLACMKGQHPEFYPGYPNWGFFKKGGRLYVAVPLEEIGNVSQGNVDQCADDMDGYDGEFVQKMTLKTAEQAFGEVETSV